MNIIHLPRRYTRQSWGGTETVISELSREQISQGHRARVFSSNALALQNDEMLNGIAVTRFPYIYPFLGLSSDNRRQLDYKGGNLFSFSLMKQLLKEPDVDIIHLHTLKRLGGIGRYCALRKKIPYAVTLHGGLFDVPAEESGAMTDPIRNTIEWGKILGAWVGSRRVLHDAQAIFCIGQQEFEQVRLRFPEKSVHLLPNGVNCSRFSSGDGTGFRRKHQIPETAKLILTAGRIDPQKNQLFALDLLKDLNQSDPDVHLLFLGHVTNDNYYRNLKERIRAYQLEERVSIINGVDFFSSDLVDAYHAADLFLLPSMHEPFGVVILEAWASKTPVVASRVGGIPSFVESGINGLLNDVNDSAGFLESIRTGLSRTDRVSSLVKNGYETANTRFSWESVTKMVLSIYKEMIHENNRCK
jgi:D-inositol-3-phosphate glycosyltransferase